MRRAFTWAAIVILCGATACGSTPAARRTSSSAYSALPVVQEEFDPQTLNDDDFLLQPGEAIPSTPVPWASAPNVRKPAVRRAATRGYRIQIAAIIDRVRAETLRSRAELQLKQRVYIAYDELTRLYKLHVGNSRAAAEAEALRKETKAKGYPEAFIVRSRIEVAPSPYRLPTERGFRVQIFSATGREAAERAVEEARQRLEREDIYIEFEPPYFKVRVGNFRAKSDADAFLKTARRSGYDTPFPIQTEILSKSR